MNTFTIYAATRVFRIICDDQDRIIRLKPTNNKFKESKDLCKNLVLLKSELEDYFAGKKIDFKTKILLPNKTKFSEKVYNEMKKIPYGKTLSYGQLAAKVHSPKASRAVGSLCKNNPLPFIIPCHRVVAANGIGGFAFGINEKKALLAIEGLSV